MLRGQQGYRRHLGTLGVPRDVGGIGVLGCQGALGGCQMV